MDKNKRTYQQFCGLAKALDAVGDRWTLLLVRNLLLGPQRYSELLRGLPGITTNLLAKRLKDLGQANLIERIRHDPGDPAGAYRLTERGATLEPAIHALGSWGWDYMREGPTQGDHVRFEWFLVALRRRYLGGRQIVAELVADEVPYVVQMQSDDLVAQRGGAPNPDVVLRGPGRAIIRWLQTGDASNVEISGDPSAANDLRTAFRDGD